MVQEYYIGSFDPASGRLESFEIPSRFFAYFENAREPGLAVFPDRVLLVLAERVIVYNRATKTITTQPAPLQGARTLQIGPHLLLYNAESLLQTTAALKDFEVLASVRRRPALTPLDSLPTLEQGQLLRAGDNEVLALVNQTAYRREKTGWHPLFSPGSSASLFPARSGEALPIDMAAGELLVREEHRPNAFTNIYRGHFYGPACLQGELWWSGAVAAGPSPPNQQGLQPEAAGVSPKYPLLPAAAPFFWLQGRFYAGGRAGCFPFQRHLLSLTLPTHLAMGARLEVWRPDDRQPFTLQVSFPDCPMIGANPAYPPGLLVTPQFLFLWYPEATGQIPGIWCIDGKECLKLAGLGLDSQQLQETEQARHLARLLAPYDGNQNSQLDPEEYSALAKEPALFNLVWSALDQNHNHLIDRDELRWFDFNNDSKLDPVEHQAVLNAVSFLASALFLHLDRNQDGGLDQSETVNYCNSVTVVPNAFARYAAPSEQRLNLEQWTGLFTEVLDRRLVPSRASFLSSAASANPTREFFLEAAALERVLNQTPLPRPHSSLP